VVMTCVSGHLTGVQFGPGYKDWSYPPPESLFEAPILTTVDEVCSLDPLAAGAR
jgi:DNA topoisomerase-3